VGKCFIPENGIIEKWDQKRLNEGQSCLTVDDHLIPFNVKRRFKQLVNGRCVSTSGAKSTLTQYPSTMFGCEIERVAAGDSDNLLASTNR
jgi:hypothetical protein